VDCADLGSSSMAVCKSKLGMGSAIQGPDDVGIPSQTVLVMASRNLGYPDEFVAPSTRLVVNRGDTSASLCMSAEVELSVSLSQKRVGGGFTIEALHLGVEDNLLVPWFPSSHGMGLWKFISKEWHRFSNHIRLILGDGSIINFWEEVWCGSSPLLEVYLGLIV
jgi:hypothetical protein